MLTALAQVVRKVAMIAAFREKGLADLGYGQAAAVNLSSVFAVRAAAAHLMASSEHIGKIRPVP
jgi:hypothetical protein